MRRKVRVVASALGRGCAWLAILLLVTVLVDRILGLVGLPGENPAVFSHPPDYQEERESLDFLYVFRTNSQGLKSPEIPLPKGAGESRLLVLGDSFVEGYGVDTDSTFSALIEQRYSSRDRVLRVINGGLSGGGPLDYARLYQWVGLKYNPDAVVLCVFANDLTGMRPSTTVGDIYGAAGRSRFRGFLHALLPRLYTRVSLHNSRQRLIEGDFIETVRERALSQGVPADAIAAWVDRLPPGLVDAVNEGRFNGSILSAGLLNPGYWVESLDLEGPAAEAKWKAMVSILEETVRIARQEDDWIGLVYVPPRFQYDPSPENPRIWSLAGTELKSSWLGAEVELQKRLSAWSRASGLPYFDLTPGFISKAQVESALNYRYDDHWAPAGHRLASELIGAWLREQGVI